MSEMDNTTRTAQLSPPVDSSYDAYNDNKDIIWPTVVGIFVALSLGWMICRYKCSSKDRSPHIVRCCPRTLCQNIRLCCMCVFRIKTKEERLAATSDARRPTVNKLSRGSESLQEAPFLVPTSSVQRPSFTQASHQWPPPFVLNQSPTFPITITVQSTPTPPSQPKRHPLRRDSAMPAVDASRRESSLWPFRTINAVFHKQTSEMKGNDLFFSA